jgi:hypothetical protein
MRYALWGARAMASTIAIDESSVQREGPAGAPLRIPLIVTGDSGRT